MTDAQHILDDLQPLPSRIQGFLEEAVPIALQHLEEWPAKKINGEPAVDPHLFPHLVRYHVCRLLQQANEDGLLVSGAVPATPPDIRTMAMSGLEILHRGRRLKLWKSRKGGIPLPGRSGSRKAFLQENRLLFDADTESFFNSKNLVLLWDVDSTGDITLELVCPMPSDFEKDDVEDWKCPQLWSIPVPEAATLVHAATINTVHQRDLDYAAEFGVIESDANEMEK